MELIHDAAHTVTSTLDDGLLPVDLSSTQIASSATTSGKTTQILPSSFQIRGAMKFFFEGEREFVDSCGKGVEITGSWSPVLAQRPSQQKGALRPYIEGIPKLSDMINEVVDVSELCSRNLAPTRAPNPVAAPSKKSPISDNLQQLVLKRSREIMSRVDIDSTRLCPPPTGLMQLIQELLPPALKKQRLVLDSSPSTSGSPLSGNLDADVNAFRNLQV